MSRSLPESKVSTPAEASTVSVSTSSTLMVRTPASGNRAHARVLSVREVASVGCQLRALFRRRQPAPYRGIPEKRGPPEAGVPELQGCLRHLPRDRRGPDLRAPDLVSFAWDRGVPSAKPRRPTLAQRQLCARQRRRNRNQYRQCERAHPTHHFAHAWWDR